MLLLQVAVLLVCISIARIARAFVLHPWLQPATYTGKYNSGINRWVDRQDKLVFLKVGHNMIWMTGSNAPNENESRIEELVQQTQIHREDAVQSLRSATSSKEIELFRVLFLGKKGKITAMMKEMKSLPKELKPKLGEVVNIAVQDVELEIEQAKKVIEQREYEEILRKEDLGNTMEIPSIPFFRKRVGSRHPLNLVMDLACDIFSEIGYEVITGPESSPEIENDFYNFEALGMPFSHPARDMQDTLYINMSALLDQDQPTSSSSPMPTGAGSEVQAGTATGAGAGAGADANFGPGSLLLRTHTSAVQIREMEKRTPPFKICVPGRVYRRDDVDATHFPVFHQVEILAVDEAGKLSVPHLLGTVRYFLQKMFGPDIEVKYRASYFPFTEPSMEVDVFFKGKWLEVLGCGMVDPVVLQAVGYDPDKYTGFAAGFGVERFAMIMHNIQDIRLFWENNMEFLSQFPSTSYAVPGEEDPEKIADLMAGRGMGSDNDAPDSSSSASVQTDGEDEEE